GCHPLGTTPDGYDVLSLLANGARISLFVAIFSVGIGGAIGGTVGILAAFRKGVIDKVIVLLFNIVLSIPLLVLALSLMAVFAPDTATGGRSSFFSAARSSGIGCMPRSTRQVTKRPTRGLARVCVSLTARESEPLDSNRPVT
ncbi:MAG: ABC transporter permease subunit, partial [Acidimicrobiia bacterium]|nr:ABC transporter permease subunit [Acidimicrobiia bacterium]